MNKLQEYICAVKSITAKVEETQLEAMEKAADAVSETILNNGTVYTFGTGHSHLLSEEIFYRAGGLVNVYPILDEPLMLHKSASRSSKMERLSGYADLLINDNLGIKKGDVIFIFSNSGRNTVSIEMALAAREKGMKVICITNLNHSKSVISRHPSGKLLYEVCDIVIDNCGVIGDACIPVGNAVCGPTSTAVGAIIMQALVCGVVERLSEDNKEPEVFKSGNIDGSDLLNQKYIDKYNSHIKIL